VSVPLPVRDEEPFLGEALASLSAQTLADFEVLVVDDGSRDASAEIAAEHARADHRFRVLRQEARGLVPALERARAEARARLIARMDGDDVSLPERLEAQVAFPLLLSRFPTMALAGEPVRRDRLTLRGYASLPLTV